MLGIDVSVYSGEISAEQWQKIKDDGYELAVVGLFHGRTVNRFAGQQLSGAIQAGLEVAGYILIAPWTGWTGPQQVAAGMAQAQAYKDKLRFVAVDAEIDGVTGKMIRDALDTVEELGQRPVIYTGGWWWQNRFNFSGYPLWAAYYPLFLHDDPGNLVEDVPLFGGWTRDKLVGWQYAGTTMLHGVNVDLNWFNSEWVMEGKQEEEEMKAPLYQIKGRPEIYALSAGGIELEHILDEHTFLTRLGYKGGEVQVLEAHDPIWNLPVKFLGIPADLR